MKVFKGKYTNFSNDQELIVAIGNFDGVHLGHQALINSLFTEGENLKKAIITFNPHTMQYFTQGKFQTINTLEDKIDKFQKYQIDYLYIIDFDQQFSNLTIKEMIEFLKVLNVKKVVIGTDFKFGQKGTGRPHHLKDDFEVFVVKDVIRGNQRVSSTLIKELIINGDLKMAQKLLNSPYIITATVVDGNKVGGPILGFPTANLDYDNLILPPNGVYFTKVAYQQKEYFAMANIGYNPTINYSKHKRLEVNIIDFNEIIYGKQIKLEFIKWLRPEEKFKSTNDLIKQLKLDRKKIIKLSKNI